jgi:hypothetical protein
MATERVKGSLIVGAVVAARRLRDGGRISPEAMAARLSGEALQLVDQKIELARWYPVSAFCELIELPWEVEGRREPAYLEEQGALSADRMFDSNRYQQLDFAERTGRAEDRRGLIRQSRLIATITGNFYDFLQVDVAIQEDGLCIVYGNATAFADPLIHTTVGFMNQVNVRQRSKRRWTGRRARRDEVRFHMPLPERLAGED